MSDALSREHQILSNLVCTYCAICHIVDPVEGEPCGGDAPSYATLRTRLAEQTDLWRKTNSEYERVSKALCKVQGQLADLTARAEAAEHLFRVSCTDNMDYLTCQPDCDSDSHSAKCAVASPGLEFARLRDQVSDLTAKLAAVERSRDINYHEAAQSNKELMQTQERAEQLEEQVSDLTAKLAAVEKERDVWKNEASLMAAHQSIDNYQRLLEQLTAAQDKARRLRERLEKIANHPHNQYGSGADQYNLGISDGHRCAASIAREALTPPVYDKSSALNALLAFAKAQRAVVWTEVMTEAEKVHNTEFSLMNVRAFLRWCREQRAKSLEET